jgi:hypothetical protein
MAGAGVCDDAAVRVLVREGGRQSVDTLEQAQDHRRLTTTLSDHDIPEHKALPESVVPPSSSAGQPADADPPLALADMPVPRSVTRLGRQLTAFVLSGGGSLGAVQVGMLRALLHLRVALVT